MLNGLVAESWLLLVALPRLRTHYQGLAWIVMTIIGCINGRIFGMMLIRTDHPVGSKLENEKRQKSNRQNAAQFS